MDWMGEYLLLTPSKKRENNTMEGNEDGLGVEEIIHMLGVMVLTSFSMLSEHSLFKPDSEVKNISIMSLLLLEFLQGPATDFDCVWGPEVVRLCDEAGFELDKDLRKQIKLTKENLQDMRDIAWIPEDDSSEEGSERMCYPWDWKLEVRLL